MKKKITIAIPETKVCKDCNQELPIEDFFKRKGGYKGGLDPRCKKCSNAKTLKWSKDHKEARNRHARKWREANHRNVWVAKTRCNHKLHGCKVEFSAKWLLDLAKATDFCAICGRKLDWSPLKKNPVSASPTLDRIDNEITLNENNVNIVCFRCNRMKGASTLSEFLELCRHILARYRTDVS